jgi:hypothetical protein
MSHWFFGRRANHVAGQAPVVTRRRTLSDVWFGNVRRPDPNPGPPVNLPEKMHPIVQSSPN